MRRDQQAKQHQREDELATPKIQLGQRVGARHGDQDLQNEYGGRHDDAVDEVTQHRDLGKRLIVILIGMPLSREQRQFSGEDLLRRLE